MTATNRGTLKPPAYDVEVSGGRVSRQRRDQIIRAVTAALRRERCRSATVSVALVDDATIAVFHQRYMGIEGATDVLSFDLRDDASTEAAANGRDRKTGPDVDGEIIVSIETAGREARRRRVPPSQELSRYVIHGTLHLLGHLDDRPKRARAMHRIEDELLRALRVK